MPVEAASLKRMRLLFLLLLARAAAAQPLAAATRLRVEYLPAARALGIDTPRPRFSWALAHAQRAQRQTSYRIVVTTTASAPSAPTVVWDSGTVASNRSLNVACGVDLSGDEDYSWSVQWADASGALAPAAASGFSTGLLGGEAAWAGAQWLASSSAGDAGNVLRATFQLPDAVAVARARLYIAGLGFYRATLNGAPTDANELGTFTEFGRRVLYDVADVAALLRPGGGCNALGVELGNGWSAQPTVAVYPRQLRALLSVTLEGGARLLLPSRLAPPQGPGASALVFNATRGPVVFDDIYAGSAYDARIAVRLAGWDTCEYAPPPAGVWAAAVAPAMSPATLGAQLSWHAVPITTDEDVAALKVTEPAPGKFLFDFGQTMAGQTTLHLEAFCAAGTVVTVRHGELQHATDLTLFNQFKNANQADTYTCSGAAGGGESYRSRFTSFGFRFAQVEGAPTVSGAPLAAGALTAHFVHSAVRAPPGFGFLSSSATLNAIQHATLYASLSNFLDVPTDCPSRERRGWLGDAQISFEAAAINSDTPALYTKWLRDIADTQAVVNATLGLNGAIADTSPWFQHGIVPAEPGWGYALFEVTWRASELYDDDRLLEQMWPAMAWYIETWIRAAAANPDGSGLLPADVSPKLHGDWGNFSPGPYGYISRDYPSVWYVKALDICASASARLGDAAAAARFAALAAAARASYLRVFFDAPTACFYPNASASSATQAPLGVGCCYVNQLYGLSLGLGLSPAQEAAAWAHARSWFVEGGANASYPGRFPGGIVSVRLLPALLDRFNESALGLAMQLRTDTQPSFGRMVAAPTSEFGALVPPATTLWEAYEPPNKFNGGEDSMNHIMFGGSGATYFSRVAGLAVAPGARSWTRLEIAPIASDDLFALLQNASAAVDTAMGTAAVSWAINNGATPTYTLSATVPVGATAAVSVWALGAAALATVTEGGAPVWRNGNFIQGPPGVQSAAASADGRSIIFEIGSGSYGFAACVNCG